MLVALTLAGCGGEPQDEFCERASEESAGLTKTLDTGGKTTGLLDALPTLRSLEDAAPPDIREDWTTLVDAIEGLDKAVDDAGLEPADVDGKLPADLSDEDRQALEQASVELASPEVRDAAENVSQHAKDVCQIPLF